MLIVWFKLLPALLLLLPPVALFQRDHVRYRALMRDWHGHWGKTFAHGLHAVDFFRAVLGAWLLAEAITRAPNIRGVMGYASIVVQIAIISLAAGLQTMICKEADAANAPFAFVAGLVAGFVPPLAAGYAPFLTVSFALILASAIAAGANTPAAFFPVLSLLVTGLGILFMGQGVMLSLAVASVGALTPWMLTLLFPRHFVVAFRSRAHIDNQKLR